MVNIMKKYSLGTLRWLWLSVFVLAADQLVKVVAVQSLGMYEQIPVLPFFSLTLAYNYGAAFSFLSDSSGWQRWFLSGVAIVVSVLLISWMRHLDRRERWQSWALALILGGALGNLCDRIVFGYVVDFILLHYDKYYFPAFNLADSAITIGAFMLLLDMFRNRHKKATVE
ncbi:Lipoprotein signal peptidase [invertebrate metagenome]|uniref:Lipoprotein signal peptidase n=1 Tax=invertebrate metagenome TaxID=1711999 RepID=A0A2H9TAF5_9ZZZZ